MIIFLSVVIGVLIVIVLGLIFILKCVCVAVRENYTENTLIKKDDAKLIAEFIEKGQND